MSPHRPTLLLAFLAFFWFLTAPIYADFQAGQDAYDRGDYEMALKEWQPIAEQGHTEARRNLGMMYEDGMGVPKDYKEAERWYRLACPRCDVPDAETMKWIKEGSTKSIDTDLDADGHNEVVKEVWGPGVSAHSLTIEVYKAGKLIATIDPNKFGIQANYKIKDLDGDGRKEIITWSGLWDFRLEGEDDVEKGFLEEGHSSPHRYVFVTYKLIRGEYYPWNYYTTKKKYQPYYSWKGREFPE